VIWQEAVAEQRIVVSKDEDFVILATRQGDGGRLFRLRVGNCRTGELITRLESVWADVEIAFSSGQRILELR
jgi:predicted nuclease of predicted toxin-antitoxin system